MKWHGLLLPPSSPKHHCSNLHNPHLHSHLLKIPTLPHPVSSNPP
uniref:Uncharacterized protein n=1 Tax=Populus trichocarpa TaxID=3694 RepID=A9PAZ3_POPTR|nr:unknown [Populus trichocarpa]